VTGFARRRTDRPSTPGAVLRPRADDADPTGPRDGRDGSASSAAGDDADAIRGTAGAGHASGPVAAGHPAALAGAAARVLALLAVWAGVHAVLAPLMLTGRALPSTVAVDVLAAAALTTGVLLVSRDPRALAAALAVASGLGAARALAAQAPLAGLDTGVCLLAAAVLLGRRHLMAVVTVAAAAWAAAAGYGAVGALSAGARDGLVAGRVAGEWGYAAGTISVCAVLAVSVSALLGTRTGAAASAVSAGHAGHAVQDALTQVANRSGLELVAAPMIEHARRSGQAVCCLYIDVDGLRAVNEAVGLAGGDAVLRDVAEVVSDSVRGTDVVARWSGDEFVVVGPGTGMSPLELERRVRARLITQPPVPTEVWNGRVSIGSATLVPWDEGDLATLVTKAELDMQMRRSLRRQSRDRLGHS